MLGIRKSSQNPSPDIRLTKTFTGSIFHHVIKLERVSYSYSFVEGSPKGGDKGEAILALDDVSLELLPGQSVTVLGSNGSGKTTMAKLLNALLVPGEGVVLVDGLNTGDKNSQKSIRQKVGIVFQNPDNQIISTSVEREIAFGLENLALPYEEMKTKVERALKYFNLEQYRNHPPHRLSGGEKQKVTLASVLSMQPEYLVLDEPTSLLDPLGRKEVLSLIRMLCQERNVTVIHVTQFPEEATIADRVLVMHEGKLVLDGSPLEVFGQEEKLSAIGLGVPFPMRIASALKKKGWSGLNQPLNMDVLADGIAQNIKTTKLGGGGTTTYQGPRTTNKISSAVVGERSTVDVTQNPQIILNQVSHLYDHGLPTERKALDGVSLSIDKGELIGVIGPTGSGKSTLAQHLNGLLLPTSGEVLIDGQDTKHKNTDLKKIRQKVGLVFQFPEVQLFEETVYQDISFGPKNLKLPENEIANRVKLSMERVGLNFGQFAHRSPFQLSGGEQRKVAIAGILALQPEILVLDEPTSGLDGKSTRDVKTFLRELNSAGITIIMISHNMDLIAELAQKIILLVEGNLLAFCDKKEFFGDIEGTKSAGLELPHVVEFCRRLKARGIEFKGLPFDERELVELLQGQTTT
jgi:energy-coupling factor transporter ATPase